MATPSSTGGPRNQCSHNEPHRGIPILPHAQHEPIKHGNLCATPITKGWGLGSATIRLDDTIEAGLGRYLSGQERTQWSQQERKNLPYGTLVLLLDPNYKAMNKKRTNLRGHPPSHSTVWKRSLHLGGRNGPHTPSQRGSGMAQSTLRSYI